MYKVGIIGTANRDRKNITANYYTKMIQTVEAIIQQDTKTSLEPIFLVSGGAAVIDHIAVKLFIADPKKYRLHLHLPAEFSFYHNQFNFKSLSTFDPGNISNYYHKKFSALIGTDSLREFKVARDLGMTYEVTYGFKQRNTKVAADSQILIALTYGQESKLADGGTQDTMSKFLEKNIGTSYHINLNEDCKIYTPATI